MQIFLLRHTAPDIGEGVCYGHTDLDVCDNFDAAAENIIKKLPENADAFFSSPLKRCTVLAEKFVSSKKAISFTIDERLTEMNFGEWELKRWNEIEKTELDKWAANIESYRIPGGESFAGLSKRVTSFIEDLLKKDYETVIIITSAGVIRCFLSGFKNVSLKDTLNIPVEFGDVITIEAR